MFAEALDPGLIGHMRACVQTGTPSLDNDRYRKEIEHEPLRRKAGNPAPSRLALARNPTRQARANGSPRPGASRVRPVYTGRISM